MKKVALFSFGFEPTDEFENFLHSIGYNKCGGIYYDFALPCKMWFDDRVIEYINENKSDFLFGEKVMCGKLTFMRKCGFAGAARICDVDTERKWCIGYNEVDMPYVKYIEIHTDEFGYTTVTTDSDV